MELSVHLQEYLVDSKQIDALALRQVHLICRSITDEAMREELTIISLLLMAALVKGSPRAGRTTLLSPFDGEILRFHAAAWRRENNDVPAWAEALASGRSVAGQAVERLFTEADRYAPVAGGEPQGAGALWPIIITDGRLAGFSRFWCSARTIERLHLPALLAQEHAAVDESAVAGALHHVFVKRSILAGEKRFHFRQIAAAALACRSRFLILSGGPGTGKTSVVLQLLRTLLQVFPDIGADRIALCAPTGRAKARLAESVDNGIERITALSGGTPDARDLADRALAGLHRRTVHSLLGGQSDGTFRYNAANPLPMQVVVVDEASMIPLSLFAALLDACSAACRILLVGDMHQLPSVEAGAVLGDLTEAFIPVPDRATLTQNAVEWLERVTDGIPADGGEEVRRCALSPEHLTAAGRLADHVVILIRSYRSSSPISDLADAVNRGDVQEALRRLTDENAAPGVSGDTTGGGKAIKAWLEDYFGDDAVAAAYGVIGNGDCSDADPEAIRAAAETVLRTSAVLTIVNDGPRGCRTVNRMATELFRSCTGAPQAGRFYSGMPVILGTNHHDLDLYNGDMGVVVRDGREGVKVLFPRGRNIVRVALDRLPDCEPAFALTVHKSQGSEFKHVLLVLPEQESPLLTRQIVYTGITRAKARVKILGSQSIMASAIGRRELREGGLRIG